MAVLALIATVGFVARAYALAGRSLWLDEIHTAIYAHLASPTDVIDRTQMLVNQMPLFYLFTWALQPFGDGEIVLRLPAVVFGSLTVVAVFVLARTLFGLRAAVVSSALTAVLPFAVVYSQDARPYSLFMLLTVVQFYYAYKATTAGRAIYWVGLAAATLANLYTHYVAWAATAAVAVYVGGFVLSDVARSRHPWRLGLGLALPAIVAAAVFMQPGRAYFKFTLHQLEHLASNRSLTSPVGLAVGAAAVIGLAAGYVILRRNSSTRVAVATAVGCAVLVPALAALAVAGPRDAAGQVPLPVMLALVAAFAAMALAGAHLALLGLAAVPAAARRLEGALGAGLAVALGYAPWLPSLHWLVYRSDQTVGRLQPNTGITPGDVLALLAQLDLSGAVLLFVGIGLVTLAVWMFRGRAAEAGLALSWICVPAVGFAAIAGSRITEIDPRYLTFLFPGAMLAAAAGVECVIVAALHASRRIEVRLPTRLALQGAVGAVVGALLVAQAAPALAASYSLPNSDYRAAARHIAVSPGTASVVLALGTYSDWATDCIGYYLQHMNSPVKVLNSRQVDAAAIAALSASSGNVWGVLAFPSPAEVETLREATDVRPEFVDETHTVYVVRIAADAMSAPAAIDQAETLMRWDLSNQPDLSAPIKLLEFVKGHAKLGPNLVQAVGAAGWALSDGVVAGSESLIMMTNASRPNLAATYTAPVASERDYMVTFQCRNAGLDGWQHIYALAVDGSNRVIAEVPDGVALDCPGRNTWARSFFAFTLPEGTAAVQLVLAVHGAGLAEFGPPELRSLEEPSV